MLIEKAISSPIHLVLLFNHDENTFEGGLDYQCELLAPNVLKRTVISRPRMGFLSVFLHFFRLLISARISSGSVFCASITWYPLALALRIIPGLRLYTFDDGSANVQQRESSYLTEMPSTHPGIAGWLARRLFPNGPAFFVRSRIARHWTIYPGMQNVASPDKTVHLPIEWRGLIASDDTIHLVPNIQHIYIGTISDWVGRTGSRLINREIIDAAIRWSDLYIPHPREPNEPHPEISRKYPAETLIDYYAQAQRIIVAHHNSSAALSFLDHPNVTLVDLCEADVSTLLLGAHSLHLCKREDTETSPPLGDH